MTEAERLAERLEKRIEYPTQDRNSTVMWLDKDGKQWTANTGKITQLVNPDGPEAAQLIRTQSARIAALEEALRAIEDMETNWALGIDGGMENARRAARKALGKGSE